MEAIINAETLQIRFLIISWKMYIFEQLRVGEKPKAASILPELFTFRNKIPLILWAIIRLIRHHYDQEWTPDNQTQLQYCESKVFVLFICPLTALVFEFYLWLKIQIRINASRVELFTDNSKQKRDLFSRYEVGYSTLSPNKLTFSTTKLNFYSSSLFLLNRSNGGKGLGHVAHVSSKAYFACAF